jgi:hypothetical protein
MDGESRGLYFLCQRDGTLLLSWGNVPAHECSMQISDKDAVVCLPELQPCIVTNTHLLQFEVIVQDPSGAKPWDDIVHCYRHVVLQYDLKDLLAIADSHNTNAPLRSIATDVWFPSASTVWPQAWDGEARSISLEQDGVNSPWERPWADGSDAWFSCRREGTLWRLSFSNSGAICKCYRLPNLSDLECEGTFRGQNDLTHGKSGEYQYVSVKAKGNLVATIVSYRSANSWEGNLLLLLEIHGESLSLRKIYKPPANLYDRYLGIVGLSKEKVFCSNWNGEICVLSFRDFSWVTFRPAVPAECIF